MASVERLSTELKEHVGRIVELTFADGYIAHVRLILVQPEEEPHGLIYDLVKVIAWGPVDPARIHQAAAHAASIAEVSNWHLVAESAA